jgi:predicted CXXCH cytochrome family protein
LAAGNADVPVCIDCHRAHDISDPRVTSWIVKTPELCAKCHTDVVKMRRYGLSTNVVQSYLADFHGVTARTSRARSSDAVRNERVTALCIDCHGVHDITTTGAENSPVLRANLVKTCRKCHPTASERFPDAWLSHYEPSPDRAPLVYGVKVFYAIFIPFIIGGLILQMVLHLWRVVVNR